MGQGLPINACFRWCSSWINGLPVFILGGGVFFNRWLLMVNWYFFNFSSQRSAQRDVNVKDLFLKTALLFLPCFMEDKNFHIHCALAEWYFIVWLQSIEKVLPQPRCLAKMARIRGRPLCPLRLLHKKRCPLSSSFPLTPQHVPGSFPWRIKNPILRQWGHGTSLILFLNCTNSILVLKYLLRRIK